MWFKKITFLFSLVTLPLATLFSAQPQEEEKQVVVLGGGVGALTAAVYLGRAEKAPTVFTGPALGGTITQSHDVQNWPGEVSISGAELGEKIRHQAELSGAELLSESVVSVDFSKRPFLITTKKAIGSSEQLKTYRAQSVVIALGATANQLHIPGEDTYWSQGVYSCATCDGTFYKGKVVTVVGGGDGALLEAQYLANIASKVHVVVRKGQFRAQEKQRLQQVLNTPNVEVHYESVIQEVRGDGEKMTHLVLTSGAGKPWELQSDALFLGIGSRPNTGLFQNQLELDSNGYIVLKNHQMTSVEGVYALGDVSDPEFRQAVCAAGDAAKAAMQSQQYLAAHSAPAARPQSVAAAQVTPIEIESKEQFKKELSHANGIVFIDFYATWCGPCRSFEPVYANWAKTFGNRIKFLKVNADRVPEVFEEYGIRGVPTLMVLDSQGNIVRRGSGFKEISELDKRLEKIKDKVVVSPQDFR